MHPVISCATLMNQGHTHKWQKSHSMWLLLKAKFNLNLAPVQKEEEFETPVQIFTCIYPYIK